MEKKSYTFDEIKLKMANYCVYQDRCHYEVEQKMREFSLIEEAKEEIILFLIRDGYLNEERFTRSYIRGKFYIKKWGRKKIKQLLTQKKIPDRLITNSFDEIDEQDYIEAIREQYFVYYEKKKELKEYQRKAKTIQYLLSKGYEYEVVLEAINNQNNQ